jgi:hypothetical protein
MSSIAVFLILGGATAFAASHLGKNSVGKKQLKNNAVTTAKIKKNAVSTPKIKASAVTTPKIKNDAVTGDKVNESTLGTVPSATSATNLVGQTPFFIRLGFGQTQTIAANGAVSLVADCDQKGGEDRAIILEQTSVNGATTNGSFDYTGAGGKFLDVETPLEERFFVSSQVTSGQTFAGHQIDQGWVLGPEGKMLTTNSEGIVLALNYGNAGCLFAGIVNAIG